MDSGPPDHHQDTCPNRDLIKILPSRFNHAFGDSWSDTWTHLDSPMKIRRAKNKEMWDRGPRISCTLIRQSSFKRIERPAIFAGNFL